MIPIIIMIMVTVMLPIVLMIISIPVPLGVPLMVMDAPPRMVQPPAVLALGDQIAAPVIRLFAERAVPLDRLVESDLRSFSPLLAPRPIIRVRAWHHDEKRKDAQRRGDH